LMRASIYAGIAWIPLVIGVVAVRLLRLSAPRRRLVAPMLVTTAGYLLVVGIGYLRSAGRGFLGNDPVDRRLWLCEGGLLITIALASAWPIVLRRLTRSAIASLVVAAASMPRSGGLRESLRSALGDDSLRLLYPLDDGRFVDGDGLVASPDGSRPCTPLVRGDATVALLEHRPDLLDGDSAVREVTDASGLALDNERLEAERQVQLADLRGSRARIVAAADAERRRLERDLHDGAQQQLVESALALQLEQLRATEPARATRLEEARAEVTTALADLRTLARGLYPAELADEGLVAALEVLQEASPVPLALTSTVDERPPLPVESAAYYAISSCLVAASSVAVTRHDDVLRVDIEARGMLPDLVAVEDRVGAVDGTVSVEPSSGVGSRVRVELPCGS
jgi:signal transduction histidine kinase